MKRRDGLPVLVTPIAARTLERAPLKARADLDGYDEAWLQALVHQHPEVLPLSAIEPTFGTAVAVCRELPLSFGGGRSGALDNLLITPEGGLVLVECKLWRNPQARREMVAQAMDYASAVFRLTFEELEAIALRARGDGTSTSLADLVRSSTPDFDEAGFVDALTRNLLRGRAVVLAVGDGIREDAIALAALLQSHAGARFTFALVELGVFRLPDGGDLIVQPSVLAQTEMIERGVVRIVDSPGGQSIEVTPAIADVASGLSRGRSRAIGIGEDEFFERLAAKDPRYPGWVRSLLTKAEALGIVGDVKAGLSLKHEAPSGNQLNLGTIKKDGFVDTNPASWWHRTTWAAAYNTELAALIGGQVREMMGGEQNVLRTREASTPRLEHLLPHHEEAWLAAMGRYIQAAFAESEGS